MDPAAGSVVHGWAKFLNPRSLRPNLIAASLFLTAWELLCDQVVMRLHGFFIHTIADEDSPVTPEYQSKVLSRDRSRLNASLLWFKEMGAIDDGDIELVDRLRKHRNEIAHELPKFLTSVDRSISIESIFDLFKFVVRLDRWWIREIELPIAGDYTADEIAAIPDSEIHSGSTAFLQMLFQIATGSDEEASEFYREFEKILPTR